MSMQKVLRRMVIWAAAVAGLALFAGLTVLMLLSAPPPPTTREATPEQKAADQKISDAAELNGFGWADEPRGVVRIPIDQAMDQMSRGRPAAGPPAPKSATGE